MIYSIKTACGLMNRETRKIGSMTQEAFTLFKKYSEESVIKLPSKD